MTRKQQIEFAIEKWMATKDKRKKKLVLLWNEEIPDLADKILIEIGDPEAGWIKTPSCKSCGQSEDFHPWACPKFVKCVEAEQ